MGRDMAGCRCLGFRSDSEAPKDPMRVLGSVFFDLKRRSSGLSFLNLQPQTQNPKPEALNPKP